MKYSDEVLEHRTLLYDIFPKFISTKFYDYVGGILSVGV